MKLVDNARGEEFLLKIMVLFTAHPWFTFVTSCLGGYFPLIIGFPLFLYKTKTGQTTMTSQASCIVFLHTGANVPFSAHLLASRSHLPASRSHLLASQSKPPASRSHLPASQSNPPASQSDLLALQFHLLALQSPILDFLSQGSTQQSEKLTLQAYNFEMQLKVPTVPSFIFTKSVMTFTGKFKGWMNKFLAFPNILPGSQSLEAGNVLYFPCILIFVFN